MANAKKTDFVAMFHTVGEERFYRSLLSEAVSILIKIKDGNYKGISPEIELLNGSERFLQLFRRGNEAVHLELARLFRRAGHRVYRIMRKSNMIAMSNRFLNLV